MNWLYYLAEANLYLCIFYLAYCVFLAKETHYQSNRSYLLLSCVAAFILPVLQIGVLRPAIAPQIADPQVTVATFEPAYYYYLRMIYAAGSTVVMLFLILKLYSVLKLTRNKITTYGKYKLVYLNDTDVAFSFFNYLFIGNRAEGTKIIITHELVHIRQRHSADIMFLELLKVLCWFNPCIYLLQNSLKTVHEYIADEQTAAEEADALTYCSFLVNNAYGAGGSSITHSFFNYNLLKKRIIMLNQQRSGKLARLKYLVAVPAFAGMLCASTLGFSKTYGWIDLGPADGAPQSKANVVNLATLPQDTSRTKRLPVPPKPKVDKVKFPPRYVVSKNGELSKLPPPPPPEPPKPKVDQIKFPPKVSGKKMASPPPPEPPKPKVDQIKFPPKVSGKNMASPPPPEPPKPKVDQVKFPPKVDAKQLPPPPPPEPPKAKN